MALVLSNILSGKTDKHVTSDPRIGTAVHQRAVFPLLSLQKEAAKVGFDLKIVSAFRAYERQVTIWNEKVRAQRTVLDYDGRSVIDQSTLSREDLLWAILRWSSIPGTSRHHWGTEIDVYDAKALPDVNQLKLIPSESEEGGPMAPLHKWLDELIEKKRAFGFFRPYECDRGGISPEKWHLSYTPQAYLYDESYTYDFFIQTIEQSEVELKDLILKYQDKIFNNYVKNICPYPNPDA
ncbi:MAG: M15 family metallopeptidase [Oligoflexia bacterium]|nr:M15 family metallopeptidase [Oligoflexia bacterium]